MSHLGQLRLLEPSARTTDPVTSHLAAEGIKPANDELVRAIRQTVWSLGPSTSWEIATAVCEKFGTRWQFDSVRTACARAHLEKARTGESPRGRPALVYFLAAENVPTGERL